MVFVINANAGRRIPLPELESICEDATRAVGRRPYVIATQSVEEAEELALSAHDAGAAAIFACGGDGTLSTLLQGLPIGSPTALGTAPLGTANVFAYETGLVRKPREAVVAQLAALEGQSGAIVTIDTGRATRVSGDGDATARRFLLMTGWGLDAAAIDGIVRSPRRRWLKRKFGEPTYFLSAVREAMRRSWALRLRVDGGEPYEVEMGMFTGRQHADDRHLAGSQRDGLGGGRTARRDTRARRPVARADAGGIRAGRADREAAGGEHAAISHA